MVAALAAAAPPPAAASGEVVSAPSDTSSTWDFNPVTALTADTFADPPDNDMPWVRWNIPVTAENSVLVEQLDDMYAKGIRGVEVGQGGFPSNSQLETIYTRANSLGIRVSLSHGPTKGPANYSFNADNVRKSLFVGRATVTAGASFSGAVPRPAAQAGRTETLIAVQAYKCSDSTCTATGRVDLNPDSVVDLTDQVTGKNTDGFADGSTTGQIEWTAPSGEAGERWQLIGFWARGVFAQSDPLSAAGHDEVVSAMRNYFTPRVAGLIRSNGGDIFYDSHSSDRGAPREVWTNTFAADFEERKGYDLMPHLAAAMRGTFTFSDGSHARIHDDITEARTDLWMDVHLLPIQQFVKDEYNSVLRVQPEGENSYPIYDMAAVASVLDRPEHENLYASDEIDNYLPIASANHMTGNPWYSTECCALGNGNYLGTFEDMRVRMEKSYAGGIKKLIYHTYAYRDSPQHRWPGYANWGNTSFGTAWGPRTPNWSDALAYNQYFARNEQVLTQGAAKVDVAVFYQNFLYPEAWSTEGGFRTWRDMSLQNAGYTRDYLSPELMKLPNATVKDGRLATDGPSYQALIVDTTLEPASDPVKTSMPLDAAEKILDYARSGLPVVLVGALPDRVTGNDRSEDEALRAVIDRLVATSGVHRVADQAAVPAKLADLEIQPAMKPAEPTTLVSHRRVDTATDTSYFYLYNEGRVGADGRPEQSIFEPPEVCAGTGGHTCSGTGDAVSTTITLEGEGVPYRLDASTGEIEPIAEYRAENGRVHLEIGLDRDESTIIALSTPDRFHTAPGDEHALTTTADGGVVFEEGRLVARSTTSGTASTELSSGTAVETRFGDVPEALDLTGNRWSLAAEDWKPSAEWATTFGAEAARTTKAPVEVSLDGLRSWREIPELQDASGVGTYRTTFDLPEDWSSDHGAVLELGTVVDSFALTVNGQPTPVSQATGRVDVSEHLEPGSNSIEVRVATTLINRLSSLDPAVQRRGHLQNYGLLGPVTLTPYIEAPVEEPVQQPSPVSLSLGAANGVYGRPMALQARVYGTVKTGQVTVSHGGRVVGRSSVGADGAVRVTIARNQLSAGRPTLVVRFAGSAGASASASVRATIRPAPVAVRTTARASTLRQNQRPELQVRVSATGAVPRGQVQIRIQGRVIARGWLDTQGRVTVRLPRQAAGTKSVEVLYPARGNFAAGRQTIRLSISRG